MGEPPHEAAQRCAIRAKAVFVTAYDADFQLLAALGLRQIAA